MCHRPSRIWYEPQLVLVPNLCRSIASPAASERLSSSPDRVLTRSPVRFCVVLIQMFKTDVGKQYK
uniref:Uncharacterized protein n=1 Tax=Glossina palpalis gambiensis TaxID=67801 RepID=A0A1B0BR48_9MUSC